MGNDSLYYGDYKPFVVKQGRHYKAACAFVAIIIKRAPFIHYKDIKNMTESPMRPPSDAQG
jgi:hypothetical protein